MKQIVVVLFLLAVFAPLGASVEELRKAYPWQLPPAGPMPVFALDQGVAAEPPVLASGQPPHACRPI